MIRWITADVFDGLTTLDDGSVDVRGVRMTRCTVCPALVDGNHCEMRERAA